MTTPKRFPNKVAIFGTRFIFTTLDPEQVTLSPQAAPVTTFSIRVQGRDTEVKALKCPYTLPELPDRNMVIFSIDHVFRYLSFAHDHGPFNISVVYLFCECKVESRRPVDETLIGSIIL